MKRTCQNCTLRDEEIARTWITVEGLARRPAHLCSPTCLVDWAETVERRQRRTRKQPA